MAGYTPGPFFTLDLALPYLKTTIPILFIVWAADHSLNGMGFSRPRWKVDLPVAGALVLFVVLDAMSYRMIPRDLLRHWDGGRVRTSMDLLLYRGVSFWMLVPMIATGVFLEEVLFRGYLISRLRELLGNYWAPILISSVMFGFWHWYQGPLGMVYALGFGLATATCFAVTGKIWPALIVHFAYDAFLFYSSYVYLHRNG